MVVPGLSWSPGLPVLQISGKGGRPQPLARGERSVCESHRAEAFNQDLATCTGTHLYLAPISQGKCSHPLKKRNWGVIQENLTFQKNSGRTG